MADLALTVHKGRIYAPLPRKRGPTGLHAPIGLDTSASVGLRHTRGRPPRGPRPAFVLRRNLTAARQETRFARKPRNSLTIAFDSRASFEACLRFGDQAQLRDDAVLAAGEQADGRRRGRRQPGFAVVDLRIHQNRPKPAISWNFVSA